MEHQSLLSTHPRICGILGEVISWLWFVRRAMFFPSLFHVPFSFPDIRDTTHARTLVNLARGVSGCFKGNSVFVFFCQPFNWQAETWISVVVKPFDEVFFRFFSFFSQKGISTSKNILSCFSSNKPGGMKNDSGYTNFYWFRETVGWHWCWHNVEGNQLFYIFCLDADESLVKVWANLFISMEITNDSVAFVTFWNFWSPCNWKFCFFDMNLFRVHPDRQPFGMLMILSTYLL